VGGRFLFTRFERDILSRRMAADLTEGNYPPISAVPALANPIA
jgi:hypothetical protein